jgi:hypothetical protein
MLYMAFMSGSNRTVFIIIGLLTAIFYLTALLDTRRSIFMSICIHELCTSSSIIFNHAVFD